MTSKRHGRLLRVLGVGFGLAVIIGNTIGAGIFRAPGEVASQLPNAWWFLAAWIGGGLYALLGAIQIAELGTSLPRSGGIGNTIATADADYQSCMNGELAAPAQLVLPNGRAVTCRPPSILPVTANHSV